MSTLAAETMELDVLPPGPDPLPQPGPSLGPAPAHEQQSNTSSDNDGQHDLSAVGAATPTPTGSEVLPTQCATGTSPSKVGSRCCAILKSTVTSNVLGIPGLLIAIAGFAYMVLTQRWTIRNDKLQDCLNFRVRSSPNERVYATDEAAASRHL